MINFLDHMKFNKKLLVSSISLLLASSLAACGGDGGGGSSTPEPTSSSSSVVAHTASSDNTSVVATDSNVTIQGPSETNIPSDNPANEVNFIQCPAADSLNGYIKKDNKRINFDLCRVVTPQGQSLGQTNQARNFNPNYFGVTNRLAAPIQNSYASLNSDQENTLRGNSFRSFIGGSTDTSLKYTRAGNFVGIFTQGFNNVFTGTNLVPSAQTYIIPVSAESGYGSFNPSPQYKASYLKPLLTPQKENQDAFTGKNVRVGVVDGDLDLNNPEIFKLFGHDPKITNAVDVLEPSQKGSFLAPTENHALSVSAIIGGARTVIAPKPPLLRTKDNKEIPIITAPPTVSVTDGNKPTGSISASPSGDSGNPIQDQPYTPVNPPNPPGSPAKPVEMVEQHIGLAPGVQLYITRIWSSFKNIGKIYPYMVDTYHPAVINNSIFFTPSAANTSFAHNLKVNAIDSQTPNLAQPKFGVSSEVAQGLQDFQTDHVAPKFIKTVGQYLDPGLTVDNPQDLTAKNLTKTNLAQLHKEVVEQPLVKFDYKLNQDPSLTSPKAQEADFANNPSALEAPQIKTASITPSGTSEVELPNLPSSALISTASTSAGQPLSQSCPIVSNNSASSFVCGVNASVRKAHAPLLLFAAGNYSDSEFSQALDKLSNTDLLATLANRNWGLPIPENSVIPFLLYNKELNSRNNIIVVSGEFYDYDNSIANQVYQVKYAKILQRFNSNVASGLAETYPQPKVEDKHNFDFNESSYTNYISAYGSYQCGVTAYDCVTASFKYSFPSTLLAKDAQSYYVEGTSVSTPIVSAVAAIVKQQFPWFSAKNLKTTILTTALDAGAPGVDPVFGWGIVNAAAALKGPGAFAFGNFYADMTGSISAGYQEDTNLPFTPEKDIHYNYYFANDIVGAGGLIVSGLPNQYLYLLGQNSYTGDTIVNSGNLVLIPSYLLQSGSNLSTSYSSLPLAGAYNNNKYFLNNDNYNFTKSNVYVNSLGSLYAYNMHLGKVRNNGTVLLENSTVDWYNQEPNANLIINLSSIVNNHQIIFNGNAYLRGNLILNNSLTDPQYYHLNNISLAEGVLNQVKPFLTTLDFRNNNYNNKAYNIYGKFDKIITTNSTPLQQYKLFYDLKHQFVAILLDLKNFKSVASDLTKISDTGDRGALQAAGTKIQKLYDKQAVLTKKAKASAGSSLVALQDGAQDLASTNANNKPNSNSPSANNSTTNSSNKPEPTPLVTALGYIQNLNVAQLQTFLYNTAGTVYSSSQGAVNQQALLASQRFDDKVGIFANPIASPSYANSEIEIAKPLFKAYANYNYANHDWKHKLNQSSIEGKQISNSAEFGMYGQYLGWNYGVGAVHTSHQWHEILKPSKQDLTPSQAAKLFNNPNLDNEAITGIHNLALASSQTLGTAKVDSYGLNLSAGLARQDYYLQATGFANFNSFTLHRSSLFNLDQLAKFKSNLLGLTLGGGYKLPVQDYLGAQSELVVKGSLTAYNYHQAAFQETVDPQAKVTTNNPTNTAITSKTLSDQQIKASSVLSFDAKAHNSFGSLANLGALYSYNFRLLGTNMKLSAGTDLQIGLVTPKLVLDLTDDTSTSNTFENKFLANFTLGYAVKITNDLEFSARGSYQVGDNWSLKQANLGLTYKF